MSEEKKKKEAEKDDTEVRVNKSSKKNQKQASQKKQEAGPDERVEALEVKVEELNDKYLRLFSEFDNYRKRTSREKLELLKTASGDVILSLLPVIDDLERAIKAAGDVQGDNHREGLELIYNKLMNILGRQGLEPIEAMGETFDTDFHEAITNIPASSPDMKGKVVDVTERGYKLNDKVIRYAKVIVGV
jgi:molecular chaperone GrpE